MFPQTSTVFHDNEIVPYENPEDIGNKALYILISSKVDEYFQRAIKQFEGHGDKALSFIKIQCANINPEDTHHFHHLFTTLRIKDNESATNFFRRFTFARMEAEAAGNTYSEQQLVSFALAGMNNTSNSRYDIALQLYRLESEQNPTKFTLEHLEKKFFTMDEHTARDNALTRIALGHAANSERLQHEKSKEKYSNNGKRMDNRNSKHSKRSAESAHVASSSHRKIICYNCGKEGHIAPDCKAPKKDKKQQANAAQEKQGNEIACSAFDVLMSDDESTNASEQMIVITDNHNAATQESTNMFFVEDKELHFYLMNHHFVSMYFEAYDFFLNNTGISYPSIECCIHSKPLCEACLDYARIINLDLRKNGEMIWEQLKLELVKALNQAFHIYPTKSELTIWLNTVHNYLITKIQSLQHEEDMQDCTVFVYLPMWALSSYFIPLGPTNPSSIMIHRQTNTSFLISMSKS